MKNPVFIPLQYMVILLACAPLLSGQATSSWVYFGPDGHLQYKTDPQGNHIMDFSSAGYAGGGVPLPAPTVAATVNPSGADDTANIQAAINTVSAMTPDANGFRGAVLLSPGTYNVSTTLKITASGVVLRGSGSGPSGTIINMSVTAAPFTLFSLAGSGSWQTSGNPSAAMTDSYVPSGAVSFDVDNASGFNVGDTVLIDRTVTQPWIHLMGMDTLVRNGLPQTWISAGSVIRTDRVIAGINGNQITLDVPLTDSFDSAFLNPPGGSMAKYTFPGRITQVGVEHLSVIAPALNAGIGLPQFTGFSMSAVLNGWAQDLSFQDTQNTVTISGNVKQVTLDGISVNHTVGHTGDRMADFGVDGTEVLVNHSSSNGVDGEWAFVTQGEGTGPIVLLNFSTTQHAGVAPHQRWTTGLLVDNATIPNAGTGVAFSDRGNAGSGQGWDMGWGVAWNVTAPGFLIQDPPGAHNWCIGCIGNVLTSAEPGNSSVVPPTGIYDSRGAQVTPASLYMEQLKERQGGVSTPPPDFLLTLSLGTLTVNAGQSASEPITVSGTGGFNQTVTLSCSGAPAGSACSVSPSTLNPNGGSATAQIAVTSTARSAVPFPVTPSGPAHLPLALLAETLAVLAMMFMMSRRRRIAMVLPCAALLFLVVISGCGGGGGSSGNNSNSQGNGTPAGSYTLTVTATAGNQSHSATVKFVVN